MRGTITYREDSGSEPKLYIILAPYQIRVSSLSRTRASSPNIITPYRETHVLSEIETSVLVKRCNSVIQMAIIPPNNCSKDMCDNVIYFTNYHSSAKTIFFQESVILLHIAITRVFIV